MNAKRRFANNNLINTKEEFMKKIKIITILFSLMTLLTMSIAFTSCNKQNQSPQHASPIVTPQNSVTSDNISNRVAFGKKYYALNHTSFSKNAYYTFNSDGTATYNHIMQEGGNTIYHQVLHFAWTYAGDGKCIMIHNGTQLIKGTQDDVFGFGRVMHLSKDAIYWTASGENSYFINEDFTPNIPNYSKFITK